MQNTLPKNLNLFEYSNPFLLTNLGYPWNISTPADLKKLPSLSDQRNLPSYSEAQTKLDKIRTLINSYEDQNFFHPPKISTFAPLFKIMSPKFREELEPLALEHLNIVHKLLPVYVHATRTIEDVIFRLYQQRKILKAKAHANIKENADFEIIMLADFHPDPRRTGPDFLIKQLYQAIQLTEVYGLTFEASTIEEEDIEEAFIELRVGDSKVIIRDYSIRYHVNAHGIFGQEGESSFRSRFLTSYLLLFMQKKSLLPQQEGAFPQDLYPFMVREFLRLTETQLLVNSLCLGTLNQVEEENRLWNELLNFYQQSENLYSVLYSAQQRLKCFKDHDFLLQNRDNTYSINFYSSYGNACPRLLEAFQPVPVLQREEDIIDETLPPCLYD